MRARIALFAAIAFASAGTAEHYAGLGGVAALFVVALAAGPPVLELARRTVGGWSSRTILAATLVLLLAAIALFAVVYPLINVHAAQTGSDRDEDADIAARRLLHAEYPYHAHTYLGNSLTHMPGSILLAVPFVLIGWSALQNVFWLPAFAAALRRTFADPGAALLAVALVLVTPAVLRELVSGGDLISNAIYMLLGSLAVLRLQGRGRLTAAVFLGVALSSRANYVFVLPLLVVAVARVDGIRSAAAAAATSAGAFVAVTLPFYAADPSGFTPLHTTAKLSQFDNVVPDATAVTVALGAVATLALCRTRMGRSGSEFCRNVALVQAVLVLVPVILESIHEQRPEFEFLGSGYGIPLVVFGVVGAWPALCQAVRPRSASAAVAASTRSTAV